MRAYDMFFHLQSYLKIEFYHSQFYFADCEFFSNDKVIYFNFTQAGLALEEGIRGLELEEELRS